MGIALAAKTITEKDLKAFKDSLTGAIDLFANTRPTAVNLAWAVDRQLNAIGKESAIPDKVDAALITANAIADGKIIILETVASTKIATDIANPIVLRKSIGANANTKNVRQIWIMKMKKTKNLF